LTLCIAEAKQLLVSHDASPSPDKEAAYNKAREVALNARWEMTIHRQACGFVSNNYNIIEELYPMPPRIQKDDADATATEPAKKFGTQTDWWRNRLRNN
jgi:hypothetical protein